MADEWQKMNIKKVFNKKEQNIIIETALPQTMNKTNDDDEKS